MKLRWIAGSLLMSTVMAVQANPITRQEARQAVEQLVSINDNTTDEVEVSPYYIFSRGDGQGFVIASGDDCTAPILGIVETGNYDESLLPEQLLLMLQSWHERIGQVQQQPSKGIRKAPRARAIATYKQNWEDVPALVKTHWHQSAPYNNLAPIKNGQRCMTGCVATAGSQVTYYFHRDNPTELQYDTPTYGYGTPVTESLPKGTPIRWDLMRLSGNGTEAQNNAVATLMYALGTSAWLTYGEGDGLATSGHNYKMGDAMKGQFHLNYTHKDKSSVSQQSWETTIYNNLKNKQPMLYSGVHPEQGGHSVVLDGYQKSTGLYHFNFGWGGQGDGWFTVDDATGMNGFNTYQDLVYNITPQKQNLAGEVISTTLYHKAPCNIEALVKNNGTLDYSSIFIYTNSQPTISSQIAGRDTKTIIESEKEERLSFTITPTSTGKLYVFLCDKNKNVLDTCEMQVEPTTADLRLNKLTVDAGNATTEVDDITFQVVNNTTANICATLTNGEQGTFCMPAFQCFLDQYDEATKEWTLADNIVMNTTVFETGQTQDVILSFTSLTEGKLYRAYLNNSAMATTRTPLQFLTNDSIVYFTPRKADLTIVADGRQATVTGHWNAALFSEQAKDANITSYDITQLQELNEQPVAANPNALFYTDSEIESMTALNNIVVGDACRQLVVQRGYDFIPTKTFTAGKATFVMPEAEAGKWQPTIIPFAAQVPFGMQVKQLDDTWTTTMAQFSHTLDMAPFTPLLCLTGHNALNYIEADNVTITKDTIVKKNDDQLVCATVSQNIEPTWLVLGDYLASIYFIPANDRTEAVAFEPFIVCTKQKTRISTTTASTTDAFYKELSSTINSVYEYLVTISAAIGDTSKSLQESLYNAEYMLTHRSGTDNNAVSQQSKDLREALATYQEERVQGISEQHVTTVGDVAPQYYDLKGRRLAQPVKGLIIVRQGSVARKILIK